MKRKDRDLNERAINAAAELSSRLRSEEFIEPGDFGSLTRDYEALAIEADRRTGKFLASLGFIDKGLKANLDEFCRIYGSYPELLRKHNDSLAASEAVKVGCLFV